MNAFQNTTLHKNYESSNLYNWSTGQDYKDFEILRAHDMIHVKNLKLHSLNFASIISSLY